MERIAIAESSTQGSQTLDRQSTPLAPADFISHLPDHLICHILSFLPTKDSVATSVLSKRWRPLWAHVPTLDLYTGNHSVHHVISLHEAQSLDSFFLEQENSDDFTESDLEEWMTYIIERNVKQIWLDLSPTDSVTLPNCLFSSRTLVTLGLVQCTLPTFSGPTSLPNLKRLNLLLVEYEVNSTLSRLLDGCPTLEELTVDGTANAFGQLIIRSSTLRRLELNSGIDGSDCSVVVDAPGLRRLKMGGYLYGLVQLYPMASLVEADICLSTGIFEEQVNFYAEGISLLRLLKRLSHVTKLKLSGYDMNFPYLKSADLYVKFNNLVRLELGADWCIIPKAFKSAENLKVLTIHNGYFHLKRWPEDLEGHCACLLYSLQTITIHKFGCTEEELDVVRFILGNARVLERMEICSVTRGTSPEAKSKALERIRLFNRESEECELIFA